MIAVSDGRDVCRFLDKVASNAARFSFISISSPYIDEVCLSRMVSVFVAARRAGTPLMLITTSENKRSILARLGGHPNAWEGWIRTVPNIHAKAYVAIGRRGVTSEAIVTSANLTTAGMERNVELGVRATSTTTAGRRLLGQVQHLLGRIRD